MTQNNMKQYDIDPELRTYLDTGDKIYPSDTSKLGIEDIRSLYLQMAEIFQATIAAGINLTDHEIPGRHGPIPIRIYENRDHRSPVTVIYYHGGGFIMGNLDSHDSICAEIADATGYKVIAIDYRLAPEFVHPVQFEDALDAFLALDHGHTIVAGDSSGGNLAAAVCIAQHGSDRQPLGQVLIYPWLGGDLLELDSYKRHAAPPGLSVTNLDQYRQLRTGEAPLPHDPIYYPLALVKYGDLPPCACFAAEYDPLCDDGTEYVKRLQGADVDATCIVEPGLIHGYLRARHCSEKAKSSFARICAAIKQLGDDYAVDQSLDHSLES